MEGKDSITEDKGGTIIQIAKDGINKGPTQTAKDGQTKATDGQATRQRKVTHTVPIEDRNVKLNLKLFVINLK